jgi:hypothetical protein
MNLHKARIYQDTLQFLKECGDKNIPITFDELIVAIAGADGVLLDELGDGGLKEVEREILATLDSIGVNESTINKFMSYDDKTSKKTGLLIAKSINNTYTDLDIAKDALDYQYSLTADNIQFDEDIEEDNIIPQRKTGYKRVLVVRNGKKVWINKRLPNKKVILSPAKKRALAKARIKAHTASANIKREKSLKKRKIFGL